MTWTIPADGEIDRIIEQVYTALIKAREQLLSGLWVSELEAQNAAAVQRYLDGPVQRWKLTGYAYYAGADKSTITRWKNAGQAHINAATDWGVHNEDTLSIAVDTVAAIPKGIQVDVAHGTKAAGDIAGKIGTGIISGVFSSPGALVIISFVLFVGYIYFRRR